MIQKNRVLHIISTIPILNHIHEKGVLKGMRNAQNDIDDDQLCCNESLSIDDVNRRFSGEEVLNRAILMADVTNVQKS